MRVKQRLALVLSALLLLLTIPVSAKGNAFTDITDAETAQNVEVLQMMGVISGVSPNRFDPNGSLTRAQFTKMAVIAQGRGDEMSSYESFTIFPDVKSSHWASGYINLAVRGEKKFISGFANGIFGPAQKITFGQAVTILMRLLGYTDADVGLSWPTGYLTAAATAGLTDGVALGGGDAISRAQAAKLFVNLLRTNKKEEKIPFCETVAVENKKDVILKDANAKTDDGSAAIETTDGTYKLAGDHQPVLLQGRRGTLLIDSRDNAWAFIPSAVGSVKDITVSAAKSGSIKDKAGKEYTISANVKAYYKDKVTTYGEIFVNLRAGTRVTLHCGIGGKVESIFVGANMAEDAIVIAKDGNGAYLGALTGGREDYTIYRNGEKVLPSDLRAYDVATYYAAGNEIQISTLRLSGRYENAYPNTQAPTRMSVLGCEFEVLPTAIASLSSHKLGDQLTLLLTSDEQVAGVVDAKKLSGNSVGIAQVNGDTVSVDLLDGITLTGKLKSGSVKEYDGLLVTASSWQQGYLSLKRVRQSEGRGTLDVAKRELGTAALAENVQIFERVKTGPVAQITLDEIRTSSVPRSKILHSSTNDNGKVDLLVLDNVTGDRFQYGRTFVERKVESDSFGGVDYTDIREELTLKTDGEDIGPYLNGGMRSGDWGGIVVDAQNKKVVAYVKLDKLTRVTNAAWLDEDTVLVGNQRYAVSDDVIGYNRTSGKMDLTLSEARAFDDDMILYVDDFDVVRVVEVG